MQIRRTGERANRANVSLYAADMRGLHALVPGGSANEAGARGISAFSGASMRGQADTLAGSQDTLTTLADDTGGRAFLSSNAPGDVLQDQLLSDLSLTDLSVYAATAYFRLADSRMFVPISVVVPGYQLPFSRSTDKTRATIDILAVVRDAEKQPVGRIRDTIRLAVEAASELEPKTVQYETGLELAPGRYAVKVVVRENVNGTMGSYEKSTPYC